MVRWIGAVAAALLLAAPAPAGAGRLDRHAPVLVHDSAERDPLTSVRAFAGRVPGAPAERPGRRRPAVIYGRRTGRWLQYWMLFRAHSQDLGILGTGRHEGDWETIQLRLRAGRPVRAVYGQHGGAEACGYRHVRLSAGRPVAYVANGSHAAYFVPGLRDRTWPAPNDEADGRGARVRPRVVRIAGDRPPWMRHRGRWGATRAGWFPGEAGSPRGPAFAGGPARGPWTDPGGWAASARPCTRRECDRRGECDGRETAAAAVIAGFALLLAGLGGSRRLRLPLE